MRDFLNHLSVVQALAPALVAADAEGAEIDLDNFGGATVFIDVGTWTDGVHTFSLEKNIDGAGWVPVPAEEIVGGAMPVVDGAPDDDQIYTRGFIGHGNLRVISTVTGAPGTGAFYGAYVIRHQPRSWS